VRAGQLFQSEKEKKHEAICNMWINNITILCISILNIFRKNIFTQIAYREEKRFQGSIL